MKSKKTVTILGIVILAALSGAGLWRLGDGAKESPFVTVPAKKGDITQVVSSTGTLQAVITVQVGSQVSGTIDKLYADFNSKVKEGEIVAQLNQDKFKAAVDQAKANLLAAESNLAKATVAVVDTRRTFERNKELRKRDLVAQSDLDAAQTSYQAALAQVEVNKAQTAQAQAALNQATVDLDHTVIRSPVDGIVISRTVDVGQTVAASLQAPVLFTIANDLSKMEVHTNVDEADVGKIWEGQEVAFTVDAHPGRRFQGKVFQVRNAPTMVENVVTYDAVVRIENKDLALKPGMTANVDFVVSEKANVLYIPNMAIRFKLPGQKSDAQSLLRQESRRSGSRGGGRRLGSQSRRGSGRNGRRAQIYVLRNLTAEPVDVQLGISDGSRTEVTGGGLSEGDEVIVSLTSSARSENQSGVANPFQQQRRPRGSGWLR